MNADDKLQFSSLEQLRRFLAILRSAHVASLQYYYTPEFAGFYHKHEKDKNKMSKSSTSTCVMSLVKTGNWNAGPWKEHVEATVKTLIFDEWKSAGLEPGNPFTVSFILEAVLALESFLPEGYYNEESLQQKQKAIGIIEASLADGKVSLSKYPPSAYLTQLAVRVLKKCGPLDATIKMKVASWAWQEIDHQLALIVAKGKNSDLFQLAYSIILASEETDSGEATPDQSLILRTALDQLFLSQLEDGTWPRSQPLFHYPTVGSAYCYEYEMLVQLLDCTSVQPRLLKYIPQLSRAALALDDTAFNLDGAGRGWSSGHHPQLKGPESWSTASVYHYAYTLDRLVAEAIRRAMFEDLDVPYMPPGRPTSDKKLFAPNFLDCPLKYKGEVKSLKETLFKEFVERVATDASQVEAGRSMAEATAVSAIFFGPPGTSKTELSKQIADYLHWPRLTVDPSYFVRDGLDKIQAQADRLFNMLSAAERVVVLLDEFDEMVRDRASSSEILSRFLTTAMLPKLATINKARRIVFIVATNYIQTFDLAISRSGRFDLIVQVMPPTYDAKLANWKQIGEKLAEMGLENDQRVKAQIEALTYDEIRSLVPNIINAANKDALKRSLDAAELACTMQALVEPQAGDGKKWKDASIDQETRIRLPSGN